VDEVERFTRCGADGRSVALAQDQSSSGSQQSPASASAGATPAPEAAPAEKPSDGGAAQGKSAGPHRNGVQSGQLTAGETAKLEKKEAASTRKRQRIAQPTAGS